MFLEQFAASPSSSRRAGTEHFYSVTVTGKWMGCIGTHTIIQHRRILMGIVLLLDEGLLMDNMKSKITTSLRKCDGI